MHRWRGSSAAAEVPLGGNVTAGLVRVGATVRRPAGPWTPAVHALLVHLREVGFEGAPRSLGLDERGRHVVEWIDGTVTHPYRPGPSLVDVGRLARRLHEATAGFVPPVDAVWGTVIRPDGDDLVVHHDLSSWNLVHGCGRVAWIDWDTAGPGTRLWDLAWAAISFADLVPAGVRDLADGYGLPEGERRDLVDLIPRRAHGMVDLLRTGGEPWSRLAAEGHLVTWETIAARARAARPALLAALLA
ncbi:phosphotransferase [Iamia sp. SCSIO 61187]|uniref:phosphotransferase n=1 Tax=Iamia sp. SCSIO 61187 TaxID=2722752 RepID=UPI001C627138|nr:phosphotransferase [Iamia sp. SCSIO 61187]